MVWLAGKITGSGEVKECFTQVQVRSGQTIYNYSQKLSDNKMSRILVKLHRILNNQSRGMKKSGLECSGEEKRVAGGGGDKFYRVQETK